MHLSPSSPANTAEVLQRVREFLPRLSPLARRVQREVGGAIPHDELLSFGREGLLSAARTFEPSLGVPFGAWATRRVRFSMIDGARARRPVEKGAPWDEAMAVPCDPGGTPEALLARRQLLFRLRVTLSSLPPRERALLERCYYGGASIDQAARDLGLSRSWGSRLHARALERVSRELRRDAGPW